MAFDDGEGAAAHDACAGTLAEGDHSFRSSNGKIALALPAGSSFRLDAQTSNGKIHSDFAVGDGKKGQSDRLRGSVGDHPDTTIKVTTSNGSIDIRKK
jgi:DUF4097 and DUF4098 domain-containing protein YvlB